MNPSAVMLFGLFPGTLLLLHLFVRPHWLVYLVPGVLLASLSLLPESGVPPEHIPTVTGFSIVWCVVVLGLRVAFPHLFNGPGALDGSWAKIEEAVVKRYPALKEPRTLNAELFTETYGPLSAEDVDEAREIARLNRAAMLPYVVMFIVYLVGAFVFFLYRALLVVEATLAGRFSASYTLETFGFMFVVVIPLYAIFGLMQWKLNKQTGARHKAWGARVRQNYNVAPDDRIVLKIAKPIAGNEG